MDEVVLTPFLIKLFIMLFLGYASSYMHAYTMVICMLCMSMFNLIMVVGKSFFKGKFPYAQD